MKQKGFILIVSLIFLVILTMLGISMFSGVTLDERISGNQREKSRSIDAAQVSLNAAENWLANPANTVMGGTLNSGVVCNITTAQTTPCSNALATPATPTSWSAMALNLGSLIPASQVSATGGTNTYYAPTGGNPVQTYVQFLGFTSGSTSIGMYQVTAAANGGNNTATTVVQAVYQVRAKSTDLGGS